MNTLTLVEKDVGLLNRLIHQQPELQSLVQMVHVVKQISAKTKYPIESFDDISEALGPDASITFRGREQSLAAVRDYVPAYYFPIASERDLVAKLSDLAKSRSTTEVVSAGGGIDSALKFMPAIGAPPVNSKAPQISQEEILRISEFGKQSPGAGGLGKR